MLFNRPTPIIKLALKIKTMDDETPQQNEPADNNQNNAINSSAKPDGKTELKDTQFDINKKSQVPLKQDHKVKIKIGFAKTIIAIFAGIFAGGIIFVASFILTSPDKTSFNDFLNSLLLSLALGVVTLIVVTIFLIKIFKGKDTTRLKLLVTCIFLVVFVLVAARTLGVHSNNKIHARQAAEIPLRIQATYVGTANKDANIVLSNVSGAYLYKQEKVTNTGGESNEVNTLYCFTVPNSSSSSVVTQLNTGLGNVPVMKAGDSFTYTGNSTLLDGGSVPLSSEDISTLQNQFNQSNQIDMPFNISNEGSNSGDILALKTSNPNYYAQANVDNKVNTPAQTGQCISLARNTNTTNKLIISVEMDLVTTLSTDLFLD